MVWHGLGYCSFVIGEVAMIDLKEKERERERERERESKKTRIKKWKREMERE